MAKTEKESAVLNGREYEMILQNCNSNVFATDGKGKIIYVNAAAEQALNCPAEKLLKMDVRQLMEEGYTDRSSTEDAIRSRKKVTSVYTNNEGKRIATTSTPVFDKDGSIVMVVTQSDLVDKMTQYQEEIARYQDLATGYSEAMERISEIDQEDLVARDEKTLALISTLKMIAETDSTVLLCGESGTGKEVMAKYIFRNSKRKDKIFVPINCAAIPSDLIESELFGYERGAFTGAKSTGKAGLFEIASGGTVFLDEIGELPLMVQAKLLRVLEDGGFMRVGGGTLIHSDVRIIAATNRDLKKMVEEHSFREDLYFRLSVIPETVPPLRERPKDIDALALGFLNRFNRKHGKYMPFTETLRDSLHTYDWPGNVRELRNVIERYVITGISEVPAFENDTESKKKAEVLDTDDRTGLARVPKTAVGTRYTLKEAAERTEEACIRQALKDSGGSVEKAAGELGINRSVLYKKMAKYSIKRSKIYE